MARRRRVRALLAPALALALITTSLEVTGAGPASSAPVTTIPPITSPPSDKPPSMPPGGPGFSPPPPPKAPTSPPGPVSQPAKKPVEGFVAGRSSEVVAERSEQTKVFANPDGSRSARIFTEPVHYRDAGGRWQDIDNSVVADPAQPGTLRSRANSWTARFAPLPEGITVDTEEGPFQLSPRGAAAVAPEVEPSGDAVIYRQAWPGVDLRYQVTPSQVKEDLIFHARPDRSSFSFATGGRSFAPDTEHPGGLVPVGAGRGGPAWRLQRSMTARAPPWRQPGPAWSPSEPVPAPR